MRNFTKIGTVVLAAALLGACGSDTKTTPTTKVVLPTTTVKAPTTTTVKAPTTTIKSTTTP